MMMPGPVVPLAGGDAFHYQGPGDQMSKCVLLGAYIFMIVANAVSALSGGSGSTIGDVSDAFPTYITPDGTTFAIWGVIYLMWLVFVVAQFGIGVCPCFDGSWMYMGNGIRYLISVAFALNGVWLPLYTMKLFWAALIVIAAYLVVLVVCIVAVNGRTVVRPGFPCSGIIQYVCFAAPITLNAAWLVVATAANFFTVFGQLGWKDVYGVAGSPQAAMLVVLLATSLAIAVAIGAYDAAWPLATAWALLGLYRMHSPPGDGELGFPDEAMNSMLASSALCGSIVSFLAAWAGGILMAFALSGCCFFAGSQHYPGPGCEIPTAAPYSHPMASSMYRPGPIF
ncbi:unnamed protein product [Prorocentrum cordatum]|uniref:Uncharacterized protein n=1 Tax=Prorocentrum cordatum TaxID=2364126 RepID=A0ABN9SHM8_9DINO|nr:unnamed protein product [Polarella glacialis]